MTHFWITVDSLLAHFWLTLPPFWRTFGSLLLSLGLIFNNFMYIQRKSRANHLFMYFWMENKILRQPNRTFPKRAERTPKERTSSLVTPPQEPGAEYSP